MSEGNNTEVVVVVRMERPSDGVCTVHNNLGQCPSVQFSNVDPIALDDSIDLVWRWRIPHKLDMRRIQSNSCCVAWRSARHCSYSEKTNFSYIVGNEVKSTYHLVLL